MLDFITGKCACNKQSTTVIILFREIKIEPQTRDLYIRTGITDRITVSMGDRNRIRASVELIVVCDSCAAQWPVSDQWLKAKLTEETIQQLIEISEPKRRQISL